MAGAMKKATSCYGSCNDDGKLDLVSAGGASVAILLGNGDGTFRAEKTFLVPGNNQFSVATADFDGDRKLDVAVACENSDVIAVLFGNGDGTLGQTMSYLVGSQPYAVAAGEFNGDGRPDLVSVNFSSNNISVQAGSQAPRGR
jgi:hypothetical protein